MNTEYLHPPPHSIMQDKTVTDDFKSYLTNINSAYESVAMSVSYTSGTVAVPGKALKVPVYSATAEIDSIQNPVNGTIVYDSELDKFKFREGGAWVVK